MPFLLAGQLHAPCVRLPDAPGLADVLCRPSVHAKDRPLPYAAITLQKDHASCLRAPRQSDMIARLSRIRRSVLRLALPVTLSSLLQRAEGILAIMLVGGLGTEAIAAVGLSQLLIFIATTLLAGLSVSGTVVVAQLWGARRQEDAGEAAVHLLAIGLGAATLLALSGWVLAPHLMNQLGADPQVIELATPYVRIIFTILPLTISLQVLASILQGTGDTRTPAVALILVNGVYFALAYPLIYGAAHLPILAWIGVPPMGIRGAAWSMAIGEAVGLAILLWRARPLLCCPRGIRWDLIRSAWQVGAPASGERVLQQAGILLYTKLVISYGTVAYAAHQVGLSIEALSFLPGYGFAIAAASMVGQSIGAGKYQRATMENWEANRQAIVMMTAMGFVFYFAPTPLLHVFTNDPAVVALGVSFLKIVALIQIPLALTMVLSGSLRGAGDTRFIMGATFIGMWGVRLPAAYLAATLFPGTILAVWWGMVIDWTMRMGLMLWRFHSGRWRDIRILQQP